MEVEKHDEDDDYEDEDETGREIHGKIAVQVVNQEWTRTFTAANMPPYSVKNHGPTNILNENQTELNLFELLFTKFW